jgi:hypothetical protein
MNASGLPGWLEPALGILVLAVALLDVFLTVLYARAGPGILSPRLARLLWRCFRAVARRFGERQATVLSFCGPAVVVALVFMWALLLSLGAALVIHPALGSGVESSSGATDTGFVTALYVGGSSMSIVGASDYEPQTAGFRLLFLFNSLVGLSVTSLTLTYLMQVYGALRSRNNVGLLIHGQTAGTGDAAELVARWGPRNQFGGGYTNLSTLAAAMSGVKESHHFYPVLFYFRFHDTHYAVSRMTLVSLDAVALIRTGLDDERHGWLKASAALEQLQRACAMLATTLTETFLPREQRRTDHPADAGAREAWRKRYHQGLARLRAAGIATRHDEEAGAGEYVALRAEWEDHIRALAPAMAFRMEDVDPAIRRAEASVS